MKSGTHRDLEFCTKRRCYANKDHRWGLGHIETSNSNARHAVLHAPNDRCGLGLTETCNSGANLAVFHAQNDSWGLGPIEISNCDAKNAVFHTQNDTWGLGPIEACISGANHDVFHAQSDRWGLGPIQTYNTVPKDAALQSKSTGECGDPWRLVFMMLCMLLDMHKTTGHVWDP